MRATILAGLAVWAVLTPSAGAVEAFKGRVAQSTEAERSWSQEKASVMVAALRPGGGGPKRSCDDTWCTEYWWGRGKDGRVIDAAEFVDRKTLQVQRATCSLNDDNSVRSCKLYDVDGKVRNQIFYKGNDGDWNERKN